MAAAASGPVTIVNASKYTCDALVLLSDQLGSRSRLLSTARKLTLRIIVETSFSDPPCQVQGYDEENSSVYTRALGRGRFPNLENPSGLLSPSITHLVVPDRRILSSPIARCRLVSEGPTEALGPLYFLPYTNAYSPHSRSTEMVIVSIHGTAVFFYYRTDADAGTESARFSEH